MPKCWKCNTVFQVPEDETAEEHGCPKCGVGEERCPECEERIDECICDEEEVCYECGNYIDNCDCGSKEKP